MALVSDYQSEFNGIVGQYGQLIRVKYYTESGANANYDDKVTVTQSGTTTYISGLIQPVHATRGSFDAIRVEQGRILNNDSVMYILGTVSTAQPCKFGIGSPTTSAEYQVIEDGIAPSPLINGSPVYKKVYIRLLPNGSLFGEA